MNMTGIICGLGNPGARYANTRHNIGFMILDRLMEDIQHMSGQRLTLKKKCSAYILWQWLNLEDQTVWLLIKPLTYMNRSGAAVGSVLRPGCMDTGNLLVIHDEVDLALGRLRIKTGGGLAGHNGLRSIAHHLGTRDFSRLRFGVGRPETGQDLAGYVLDDFEPGEQELKERAVADASRTCLIFREQGLQPSMDFLSSLPRIQKAKQAKNPW